MYTKGSKWPGIGYVYVDTVGARGQWTMDSRNLSDARHKEAYNFYLNQMNVNVSVSKNKNKK